MKPELFHSEKRAKESKEPSPTTSLTDWERIDNMRDEDIIIDDEHPEVDPAYMTNIKIWKNGRVVREITKEDQERINSATASALIPSSRPK